VTNKSMSINRQSRDASMMKVGRWLLALGVAGAALAVGSVHAATLCVVTGALAIAAFLVWCPAEPMSTRSVATLLLCTGVGLTLYTALQCVPLPMAWLAAIAPHNADVWSRALVPLREPGPRWAPISLDPTATRIEVLKGVAYMLAFVTALRVARSREGVTFLSSAIVLTGIALAAAALLHPAFGAHKLYGIYEPEQGIVPRHLAPLLNPNHLAAYLNVAICLALAVALASAPPVPRPIPIALIVLLTATQVWVASRAGVVSMVLGVALTLWMVRADRLGRAAGVVLTSIVSLLVVVVGAGMMVLGTFDEADVELLDSDVSKLGMFMRMMRMWPAYRLFGAGRGTFESTYPQFREGLGHRTFTHPENIVAQWVTEWGTVVAIVGFVAIAIALRPRAVLARSRVATGAWVALLAAAVHNLVDFNSEVPGVMLAFVVCAAIVVSGTSGTRARWQIQRWGRAPRAVAWWSAAIGAVAVGFIVLGLGHDLESDQRALHDVALDGETPLGEFHSNERAAMLRHPAEPYLPFVAAMRAARARDESPVPWIGATLERSPIYGPAHFVLARALTVHSPAQARLEYRVALEQAPELSADIAADVAAEGSRLVGGFDDAMELVPPGLAGVTMLEGLVAAVASRLPATQVRLDAQLAERVPGSTGPTVRATDRAIADLDAGGDAPWCSNEMRESCVQEALKLATRVQRLEPATCAGFALHARIVIAAGDAKRGLDELDHAADVVSDRVWCLEQLEEVASRSQDNVRVESALDRIVRAGCTEAKECVDNLIFVAKRQEERGSPRSALAAYKRAYEQDPDNDGLLMQVARLAAATGFHAEALDSYSKLARKHPEEGRWRDAAAQQSDAVLRGMVKL
jgi:tetratricopeptide (TPR) repeat protein